MKAPQPSSWRLEAGLRAPIVDCPTYLGGMSSYAVGGHAVRADKEAAVVGSIQALIVTLCLVLNIEHNLYVTPTELYCHCHYANERL
jgi:hypothetical protein